MSGAVEGWFTVETIDAGTFAISEYRHWEETHCYLLLGRDRALLIDTGLGVGNIRAVTDRLTHLPMTAAVTHAHWDHMGGLGDFDDIAVHRAERGWLAERFPLPLAAVKSSLTARPCGFPANFRLEDYQLYRGEPDRLLEDGDRLDLGGRAVTVLHTPGHSPGHCCFYEPDRGYLYAGDLIYSGCLDAFYPTTDPELFRQSVKKIRALDVKRVLPGHHRLDIPTSLVAEIDGAFDRLEAGGRLIQGGGIFAFDGFQIHL